MIASERVSKPVCVFMNMKLKLSARMGVLLIFEIVLTLLNWSDALYIHANELPCDLQDSINITDGTVQSDGAILFEGIKYVKEQFAAVNYHLINGSKHETIELHLRGCPCNVKPCIRLCCPLGSFVNTSSLQRGTILQQMPCYKHQSAKNYQSLVFDENNRSEMQTLDQQFSYAVLLLPTKFYKLKTYQITNVMKSSLMFFSLFIF